MKLHMLFSLALILAAYSYQNALAQESRGRGCPVIYVSQIDAASTGPTLIYRANIQGGDSLVTPKFKWTVSTGKITRGQDTSEVLVDAERINSITVIVEVIGYPANCKNKASYTSISEPVVSRKFDEYHDLKFNEERLRLDQFAVALHNEPGSKGYIIVYDATATRKPSARERGERAKKYLIEERGLPEARIVVVCHSFRSLAADRYSHSFT
jgi:hypothetical protein